MLLNSVSARASDSILVKSPIRGPAINSTMAAIKYFAVYLIKPDIQYSISISVMLKFSATSVLLGKILMSSMLASRAGRVGRNYLSVNYFQMRH